MTPALFLVVAGVLQAETAFESLARLGAAVPPALPAGVRPAQSLPGIDQAALRETIARLSSPELAGRSPKTRGSELARRLIIERFKAYGVKPGGDRGSYEQDFGKGVNVVGFLPGKTRPDECVYVDAHYDHWGRAGGKLQPGANDNASGVAVMLELARNLAMARPERTVVFLAADYEEGALIPDGGGLKGARAHLEKPFCRPGKIQAALVLDMVGGSFVPGVAPALFLIGAESSAAGYALAASGMGRPLGVYAIEPMGSLVPRADYGPFRSAGVPFIFATSGIPPEYHTERDTIDKIDFAFMGGAGAELLRLVRGMAAAGFSASAAGDVNAVTDWDREFAVFSGLVDAIAASGQPEDKRSYVRKLRKIRRDLRSDLEDSPSRVKKIKLIREAVAEGVLTVMKMNGSLKLWDHLRRGR